MADKRFQRQVLLMLAGSGALFLAVLGVFAWLLFRSLSSRVVESVLAESRADAEQIAQRLSPNAGGFHVTERKRETESYLHAVLQEKRTVEYITVTDRAGQLIFEGSAVGRRRFPEGRPLPNPDLPGGTGSVTTRSERAYDIAVPIENLGFLHVGVSKDAVAQRLESLRGDLVRRTALAAGLALLALALTDILVYRLLERNRRLEEARAADLRLAELGTVASGLAHEIRNPLHAIGLQLQALEERVPANVSTALPAAREEVKRLDRLVTDFLAYARPAPLRPEPLSIETVLSEMVTLSEQEARGEGIAIDIAAHPEDPNVVWDPARVRQVLWNLLRNAREAIAEKPGTGCMIRVGATDQDGAVELFVADEGAGIPPELLKELPRLFLTGKRGGTGLGLAVADRIVRDHGGTLRIESELGRGTTVRIRMPREVPPRGAPSERGAA
jgi:signal transduction histidine kinase